MSWQLEQGRWVCTNSEGIRTDVGPLTESMISQLESQIGEDTANYIRRKNHEAAAESEVGTQARASAPAQPPLPPGPWPAAKALPGPDPYAPPPKAKPANPDGLTLRTVDAPRQHLPDYDPSKSGNSNRYDWLVHKARTTPDRSAVYDFDCEWQCRIGKMGSPNPR